MGKRWWAGVGLAAAGGIAAALAGMPALALGGARDGGLPVAEEAVRSHVAAGGGTRAEPLPAAGAPGRAVPDSVRLDGGQVLVRFRSMSVLLDPVEEAAPMPPVDLVLLRGCGARQRAWLARQTPDRSVVVVSAGRLCAAELRGQGVRRAQVLGLWGGYTLRQDAASVRLTVMPGAGPQGAAWLGDAVPEEDEQDQSLGVMLDFSDGRGATFRLYAGGAADDMDLAAIPQRFPGADLAVVRRDGAPLLGAIETRRDGSRAVRTVALARDAAYRIPAARAAGPGRR